MLPAHARMRRRADFVRTLRTGRRGTSAAVVVLAVRTPGVQQVGFIVSRSVGGAVTRNRVRRQLRHLLRSRLTHLPPDVSFVVRALPAAASMPAAALTVELDRALRHAVRGKVEAR